MRDNSIYAEIPMPAVALFLALLCAVILLFPDLAWAGTGGSEFNSLTDWVKGLIGGSLGRLIAFIALLIGAIFAASKMTAMPMGLSFGIAIIIAFAIPIIENIITATV